MDAVFLDFSKAFDYVPNKRILMKIEKTWNIWKSLEMDEGFYYKSPTTCAQQWCII